MVAMCASTVRSEASPAVGHPSRRWKVHAGTGTGGTLDGHCQQQWSQVPHSTLHQGQAASASLTSRLSRRAAHTAKRAGLTALPERTASLWPSWLWILRALQMAASSYQSSPS